ncbi:MAG: Gfo/Idh/MocA family oxidoreductase [Candidatus Poribacteria bacterium]|nr:Gfo/Idh/MocA family oxidoreductase [Candidatus Poribacteria bacterium]
MTTSNHTVRIGIVGAGGIAHAHAGACAELPDVELAAVCDVSPDALNAYADRFQVPNRYNSLADMLAAETLDAAIIATWGRFHAENGIELAESGKVRAILCEKPFTLNAAEAQRLVAAARENDVLLAEAFKFRHHPMHLKARQLVDDGAIGEVMSIRSTFTGTNGQGPESRRPQDNWRFNKARGGGAIYDLACYNLHHARFMFGAEPMRVFASQQPGMEVDDAAYVTLVFPNGGVAQITTSFNSWHGQYAEIAGTRGMLRMDAAWNNEGHPVSLEWRGIDSAETFAFEPRNQFADQLRHLCDCLSTGQPHRIPPENSVAQMRVIDAAFESMRTGNAVDLKR